MECHKTNAKEQKLRRDLTVQLEALKVSIYKLIDEKKAKDAAELLLKYATINPTDEDIPKIKEKIRQAM